MTTEQQTPGKRKRGRPKGTLRPPTSVGAEYDVFFNYLAELYGMSDDISEDNSRLVEALRATLFPKQRSVLDDPSRWKSVLTPRRAGKSFMAMVYAHVVALSKKGAKVIIVNLTLKSGKNVFWGMVQKMHRDFGIDVNYHHTDMRITLPSNGSIIQIVGADTRAEIEKLRGGSYDLIIIDECKSFSPTLLIELIQDVAKPALSDRRGSLVMIGTPGNILAGPFYESTYPGYLSPDNNKPSSRTYDNPETYWKEHPDDLYQWSRHTWTVNDNVSAPHLMEEAKIEKQREGWADDHPTWLREYLGQWVPSESSFVYAYPTILLASPEKVSWIPKFGPDANKHGLPTLDGEWRFLLGMDLGFEDEFAIVVAAYNMSSRELFHLWDFKASHLDVYSVADKVAEVCNMFGKFDAMVADCSGLGKMVIETLNKRHGFYIQAADKREKNDFIELINADFHSGRIKIVERSDLDMELQNLQWDLTNGAKEHLARTGKLREHPGLANHLCDAFLYLWRFSYHHYSGVYIRPQPTNTAQWWADYEKRLFEKLVENKRADLDDRESGTSDLDRELLSHGRRDPLKGYYSN